MEAYIFDAAGKGFQLPQALKWEFCHGFGEACDSFELEIVYRQEMLDALKSACRFRAEQDGRTVFRGVVDEIAASADSRGCRCTISGRGLQALLTDSEAQAGDYYGADLGFILRRHVYPLGIDRVDESGTEGRSATMSVRSGQSHWRVLRDFAEFSLGLRPRFAPDGELIMDGLRPGRQLELDWNSAVSRQEFCFERCGVISSALVKNRAAGSAVTVENSDPAIAGSRAERVINVPRRTGYDAMRHSGEYRIKKSMENMLRCTVTLPETFAAFPGDRLRLKSSPLGVYGDFLVYGTRSYAAPGGAGTDIELRRIQDVAW